MKKHLNNCVMKLKEKFGERLIYVAAYGSQNYGLSYEGSDYDFKAIIVPSFDDIVFGRKLLSTTIELEDGLCCIKDIRSMCSSWKKQNVNFVELLFTKYFYLNFAYAEEIMALRNNAERIAHYDEAKALSCCIGMAREKYAALFKPYPSQNEVVEKYGYAAKQLHHIHRLRALMENYIDGMAYKDCLIVPREKASLVALKLYKPILDPAQVKADADVVIRLMEEMRKDYVAATVDEEVGLILDKVQGDIIRKALKFELKE